MRKDQIAKTYRKDKRIEHFKEFGEKRDSTVHSARVNVKTVELNYSDKDCNWISYPFFLIFSFSV